MNATDIAAALDYRDRRGFRRLLALVAAVDEAAAYDRIEAARRLWCACRAIDGTHAEAYLADWLSRPLDSIKRREVEERFILLTGKHSWVLTNQALSLLRLIYRQPCTDNAGRSWRRVCASTRWCGGGYPRRPRSCPAGGGASRRR